MNRLYRDLAGLPERLIGGGPQYGRFHGIAVPATAQARTLSLPDRRRCSRSRARSVYFRHYQPTPAPKDVVRSKVERASASWLDSPDTPGPQSPITRGRLRTRRRAGRQPWWLQPAMVLAHSRARALSVMPETPGQLDGGDELAILLEGDADGHCVLVGDNKHGGSMARPITAGKLLHGSPSGPSTGASGRAARPRFARPSHKLCNESGLCVCRAKLNSRHRKVRGLNRAGDGVNQRRD